MVRIGPLPLGAPRFAARRRRASRGPLQGIRVCRTPTSLVAGRGATRSVEAKRHELDHYLDAGGMAFGGFVDGRLVGIGVVVPHLRPAVAQLVLTFVIVVAAVVSLLEPADRISQ
jgi:hypothetical protein